MLSEQDIRLKLREAKYQLEMKQEKLKEIVGDATAKEIGEAGDEAFQLQIRIQTLREVLDDS